MTGEKTTRVGRIGCHPRLDGRGWIEDTAECGFLRMHLICRTSGEWIAPGHLNERTEHLCLRARAERACQCDDARTGERL